MPEALRWILPILVGYLLGSIPFGYLIVKAMRGIDIRDYGSHNIGFTNVLRVVGKGPGFLTLAGDILKGALPPVLATTLLYPGPAAAPWVAVLSAMAAIWGHAYSAWFFVTERRFSRGKSVATGAGAILGFVIGGQVAWPALAITTGIWVGLVLAPKLLSGRFGWVSLGSIVAAVSLPFTFLLVGAHLAYVLFGIGVALFVTWKHKENIGRLLDGVEPRLGEHVPLAGVDEDEVACAFMVHPMTPEDWWQTRRFSWAVRLYRAGLLSPGVVKRLLKLVRPLKLDTIYGIRAADGRKVQIHLIAVPLLPEQIKAEPDLAVLRATQAARLARELGARCFGLGAYWSVVGNKGLDVQKAAPSIPITNGGAYTAGTTQKAVPLVLAKLRARGVDGAEAAAAVVGASGVVGFGICRQLVGRVARLLMIGTDPERLERSAELLRRRAARGECETEIVTGTAVELCREAEMVFAATSTVSPVVFAEHVKPGAVIYDLGRPADVDDSVLAVPDVTLIPGGMVVPPGRMRVRVDYHFRENQIPACMAETILIALDECYDRVSLGDQTRSENIDYFVQLGDQLGFTVVDEAVRREDSGAAVPGLAKAGVTPARAG